MASVKEGLLELKELVNNVLSKKIDFNVKVMENEFDFRKREREYYSKELESCMKRVEALLSESFVNATPQEKAMLVKTSEQVKSLKKMINMKNFLESVVLIEQIYDHAPRIDISDSDLPKQEFFLPYLPRDVYAEIKASFDELVKCYDHSCYRSTLILCGRILEIALHKKYFEATGIDLLEKSPDIGLGNLVLKFKEKKIAMDPGLSNQIHLINLLRIASVHKKKQVFSPTRAQTQATILYTMDTLKKLFSR